MSLSSGSAARAARGSLTAVLVLVLAGNLGDRRRSRAGYRELVTDFHALDAVMSGARAPRPHRAGGRERAGRRDGGVALTW